MQGQEQLQVEEASKQDAAYPPLLYAMTGISWPASLASGGEPQRLEAISVEQCGTSERQIWLGYANPLALLRDRELEDPEAALERWYQEARWFLQIRAICPDRCRLVNLSLRPDQDGQASLGAPPPPLDPRLILLTLHRPELQNTYADLEGCADLEGREPQFQFDLPSLRGEAFADQCLASWRQQHQEAKELQATAQQLQSTLEDLTQTHQELDEAREEAELTLLQLHQVQEELERYFLQHRETNAEKEQLQKDLESAKAHERELSDIRQQAAHTFEQLYQVQEELKKLFAKHQKACKELSEARSKIDQSLLHMHEAREELEYYFLEHRKASEELKELQQESMLLFAHSSPKPGLNRSHLKRITELMRTSLKISTSDC